MTNKKKIQEAYKEVVKSLFESAEKFIRQADQSPDAWENMSIEEIEQQLLEDVLN